VAFMLVHFFCLLEFKFRFEFFLCLNPFQNPKPKFLNYFPLNPFLPSKPNPAKGLRSSPLAHRPSPASQQATAPPRVPARLALRPSWPSSPRPAACSRSGPSDPDPTRPVAAARACAADQGGPLVIPFARRPRPGHRCAAASESSSGTP
jgi:hypothetical protein